MDAHSGVHGLGWAEARALEYWVGRGPTSRVLPPQLAMGKMMEQGPVLIVTFQAQLVMVVRNPRGEVVEGDPVSGREPRLAGGPGRVPPPPPPR